MAAQSQIVSSSQRCRVNPYTGDPVTALWFERGKGMVKQEFDDLESAEAATDAWADEAALRGRKVRAEISGGGKLISKIRYLGLPNPGALLVPVSEKSPGWEGSAMSAVIELGLRSRSQMRSPER